MLIVIRVNDGAKILSLWLSWNDPSYEHLSGETKKLCDEYRAKKYMISVFRSGRDDLYENTFAILKHNRQLAAEKEIREAKQAAGQ